MRHLLVLPPLLAVLILGQTSGQYGGTWTSDSGVNSGKVNLTLNGPEDSEFLFTYQDQNIKPKKVTAKVSGSQVELVCEEELEGFRLKSTFHGTIDGKTISGKYQSVNLEDGAPLDSGTWKVTRK